MSHGSPPDIYMRLGYDAYKDLERQIKQYSETTHTTVTGFYHKSIVLNIAGVRFEFHGPAVKAAEEENEAFLPFEEGDEQASDRAL